MVWTAASGVAEPELAVVGLAESRAVGPCEQAWRECADGWLQGWIWERYLACGSMLTTVFWHLFEPEQLAAAQESGSQLLVVPV